MALVNSAPIYWFSKKQVGIETSTFGSEFIAMKQCCEYLRGLRFKLRSMGISIEGPCCVYGDNKSVLTNSSQPNLPITKNSQIYLELDTIQWALDAVLAKLSTQEELTPILVT